MTMTLLMSEEWVPTQDEFDAFARVSGDDNPIHVDPAFSARTRFGRTVSHGMLIYARLWGMLRRLYPDTPQRMHSMMFPNPAYAGETVVLEISRTGGGHLAVMATRKADGLTLLQGETVLEGDA